MKCSIEKPQQSIYISTGYLENQGSLLTMCISISCCDIREKMRHPQSDSYDTNTRPGMVMDSEKKITRKNPLKTNDCIVWNDGNWYK